MKIQAEIADLDLYTRFITKVEAENSTIDLVIKDLLTDYCSNDKKRIVTTINDTLLTLSIKYLEEKINDNNPVRKVNPYAINSKTCYQLITYLSKELKDKAAIKCLEDYDYDRGLAIVVNKLVKDL